MFECLIFPTLACIICVTSHQLIYFFFSNMTANRSTPEYRASCQFSFPEIGKSIAGATKEQRQDSRGGMINSTYKYSLRKHNFKNLFTSW